MNRRDVLRLLAATTLGAGYELDIDRLLWVPGQKRIFDLGDQFHAAWSWPTAEMLGDFRRRWLKMLAADRGRFQFYSQADLEFHSADQWPMDQGRARYLQ